ncbi:MAG: glycosyltransferase family 2 protein [bacterium]
MTDLSIIILNYKNIKILQECLESIPQSIKNISIEIIVVDNNSQDGSGAMVRKIFPQVTLIENQENSGFAKANNLGLKVATGRYQMLLNNDTIVKEGALERMVRFMDQNKEAGACGPLLLNTDGTPQRQGGLFGSRFWKSDQPKAVQFVIGAALLVRREVIEQVGLMDENLFFYNDDLDWCLRIRKAGWKIFFLPQAEIVHYGGYSSKRTFNPRLFVEGFRGGLYFTRKHYGVLAYSAYRLLLIIALSLFLILQVFNHPKFGAYLQIIQIAARGQIPDPMIK